MLKEIHVCDRCVRGLVNERTGLSHEGLRLLIAHASLVQESDLSEISVDTAALLFLRRCLGVTRLSRESFMKRPKEGFTF